MLFNWGCPMQSSASPDSRTGSTPGKEEDMLVTYEEVYGQYVLHTLGGKPTVHYKVMSTDIGCLIHR